MSFVGLPNSDFYASLGRLWLRLRNDDWKLGGAIIRKRSHKSSGHLRL